MCYHIYLIVVIQNRRTQFAPTVIFPDPITEDENLIIRTIGYRFTAAGDYTVKIESRGTTWNTETAEAAVKIFATQSEADEYNKK